MMSVSATRSGTTVVVTGIRDTAGTVMVNVELGTSSNNGFVSSGIQQGISVPQNQTRTVTFTGVPPPAQAGPTHCRVSNAMNPSNNQVIVITP